MNYSDFQNQASSEKIVLATLDGGKRLMGWTLHSGSVYKLTNIPFSVIQKLEDSGTLYTPVNLLASVTAGKYFLDRQAKTLYIQTLGSDNPNGRFISVTFRLFFANSSVVLPYDLNSGFEVPWEPLIEKTSQFGVEIDTINQTSEGIEGRGSLTLYNDHDFWPKYFDKLYFENQACYIYSYNRDLDPSEAKLIYRGSVERRSYTDKSITFSLTDILAELRAPVSLGTIADLGLRTGNNLAQARQRLILGRVFGHVPVNTDQVLDGYPLTGTLSISYNSSTLSGSGTEFLRQLSPDDQVILGGETYTIATVSGDTSATITENYADPAGLSGVQVLVIPQEPKRWMNRTWHVAGHALREPITSVANGSNISRLIVDDATDFYADDWIYIGPLGSGELIQVLSVTGTKVLNLKTSLASVPTIGTQVRRPAIQNVRINEVELVYYTDYTFDASTATLTLRNTAESNSGPIRNLTSNLSFTNTSRTVTGTGLKNSIKPGYMVGVVGNAVFFEVLSVDSDTQLTLRSASTFTANTTGRYKSLIFNPSEHTLNLDVLGKTEDGTTGGKLLKTAPSMVKGLLTDLGLGSRLDEDSFAQVDVSTSMHLGLVAPATYNDQTAPIYRDIINSINASVFGSLIQNNNFELAYGIIEPLKSPSALRLEEPDILSMTFEATSEKVVKTSIVSYLPKEYDYLTGSSSIHTQQKTSDIANYIAKSNRERTFETKLVETTDAERMANRWAFIQENGAGRATINTKLQAINLDIGSVVEVTHRKFFERAGLNEKTRLFLVEAVRKSGSDVQLEVVDLSSAFSRIANINDFNNGYSAATTKEKLYGGYITDAYGLIDNDPESFDSNLIW